MTEPNYDKQLEKIHEDIKGILDVLAKQNGGQKGIADFYFNFSVGLALAAIGLSILLPIWVQSSSWVPQTVIGSFVALIGLALMCRSRRDRKGR